MRGNALIISIVILVTFCGLLAADDGRDTAADLTATKSLISSVNLLNGLHLSGEQLQALLDINREAEILRRQYLDAQAANLQEAESLCQTLLDNYSADQRPPEETETKAAAVNHQLTLAYDEYQDKLSDLGEKLDSILTDGQRQIVDEFKPCLVPPRSLREPSRAGQASSSEKGVEILTRYRDMLQRAEEIEKNVRSAEASRPYRPGARAYRRYYGSAPGAFASDRAKDAFTRRFFPRYFEQLERIKGEMTEQEKAAEQKRILAILDRAAALDDQEFSLDAENLASEIFAPLETSEQEIRQAIEFIAQRRGAPGRAAGFLIRPELIPILQSRLQSYAAANPGN
jgi:hypothetical protein